DVVGEYFQPSGFLQSARNFPCTSGFSARGYFTENQVIKRPKEVHSRTQCSCRCQDGRRAGKPIRTTDRYSAGGKSGRKSSACFCRSTDALLWTFRSTKPP